MTSNKQQYVDWFRGSSPYIHSHRGRTFVIYISGETITHDGFPHLIHDIALLNSLGVKLVLVHGARPQIKQQLETLKIKSDFHNGWRITPAKILPGIEQAVGQVRVNIETHLSKGLINTPMAGAALSVISGNFVTARPYGVRQGIDFGFTGDIRKVNTNAIQQQLSLNNIVLLSPIAYSPSGEAFNCRAEDVATAAASALGADKLIFMMPAAGVQNEQKKIVHQLSLTEAESLSEKNNNDEITQLHLCSAVNACKKGVRRAHLISHETDGALLLELYTRDGSGTMITTDTYEGLRQANINDVGGILELIQPLEQQNVLAHRSREQLELEIEQFTVIERDGMIIACAALYPYDNHCAELACVAVHNDYQKQGRAGELIQHVQQQCRHNHINQLFILTTHTAHWFIEKGFIEGDLKQIPIQRRDMYNAQRNSKIYIKNL
ncbi:MAG: amino-acid N-acetyltransferase [endosymbiont of Galathealinum brachiosum]|uniref:Amino-acid acetyltransferase n=1 Tax=endosymbiont of Galathealinum brachiosum TaxID=2200906 RepID=A0A370DB82_9GAMM|nr:MAG: amino-acid N-acetyltransferase [endosymbiont of Galathealinum brachiosum]